VKRGCWRGNRICLDYVHLTGRILGLPAATVYPVKAVVVRIWILRKTETKKRKIVAACVGHPTDGAAKTACKKQ
jgi:hypothetical protein